jgi:hypothetical protein
VLAALGVAAPPLASHYVFRTDRSGHSGASLSGPRVLRVGSWHGIAGNYSSIQAAVDAARPGDWILVGPGDYKERADHRANRGPQPDDTPAGVVITTPNLHLRGMDRNRVVVDGTKPGTPQCSANTADQDFGVPGSDGKPLGRNGILVWKADNVWIDNLTACNFMNGAGSAGNLIWWNGGDGGGKIGIHGVYGSYLNATSTSYPNGDQASSYGIFSSNASGGYWDQMYSSNMSDSNYYVGACQQVCDMTVNHVHSQYSSQGYSGTNAGGTLIVENSEFDHNKTGFTAGALNNDDWPSPQDGACPNNGTSPISHNYGCMVLTHNNFHDNNNPNVPGAGIATAAPTGTGVLLYGGRDTMLMNNTFADNGAWGIIFITYPSTEEPPQDVQQAGYDCHGGINAGPPTNLCIYDDWGDGALANSFRHNGFFGNDQNADIGEITTTSAPTNCYHGNVELGGGQVTTSPSGLEQSKPNCDRHTVPPDNNPRMTNQVACDASAYSLLLGVNGVPCPPGANYPQQTGTPMPPMPSDLDSMPNPCAGVPANPWCPAHTAKHKSKKKKHHRPRRQSQPSRDPDHDGDHD